MQRHRQGIGRAFEAPCEVVEADAVPVVFDAVVADDMPLAANGDAVSGLLAALDPARLADDDVVGDLDSRQATRRTFGGNETTRIFDILANTLGRQRESLGRIRAWSLSSLPAGHE